MKKDNEMHPRDLILPYAENTLSRGQHDLVHEHLEDCSECAKEARELRLITETLSDQKIEVFCPEAWELFNYVDKEEDPHGIIAAHLEKCPICRGEVESLREARAARNEMPEDVRCAFRSHPKEEPTPVTKHTEQESSFWARVQEFLSFKLVPMSGALVALLVVVVVYSKGPVEPSLALTTVVWDQANPGFKDTADLRPPIAVVIKLDGYKKPIHQDTIDKLYREIGPKQLFPEPNSLGGLHRKYRFVSPDKFKGVLDPGLGTGDIEAISSKLEKDLKVSGVLLITITETGSEYAVSSKYMNASNGQILASAKSENVSKDTLTAQLKSAYNLLP